MPKNSKPEDVLSPRAVLLIARLRAIDPSHALAATEALDVVLASMDSGLTEYERSTITEDCRRVAREINARLKVAKQKHQ